MSEYAEIDVFELKERLNDENILLLDVRTTDEYEFANIGGVLIPLNELADRLNEIDKKKEIICLCHHGGRSARAAYLLIEEGFDNVKNLVGGIHSWSTQIDSNIPTY